MNIICTILLVTCGLPFQIKVPTDGVLLKEDKFNYYVDFTKSQTVKKYCSGTVGKMLLPKNKCLRPDKE